MLWGYIKSDGPRKLVKIDGNFNSAKYIQLLKDNLIPGLGSRSSMPQIECNLTEFG